MVNHLHRDLLDSAGDCYDRKGLPTKRGHGLPIGTYPIPEPVLGASAGAAFYRRELFERIGLFDEGYAMYLEDVDLSLRAQLQGYPCMYLPNAIVFHIEAASDRERTELDPSTGGKPFYSKNRVFWITRNRWQLMVTYQPLRNLPWLFFGWSKSFLFHLLKAGFTISFMKGLIHGALLTLTALRKRHVLKRSRSISNREICRLLAKC
jgi:GT2 family glycosyltransferase